MIARSAASQHRSSSASMWAHAPRSQVRHRVVLLRQSVKVRLPPPRSPPNVQPRALSPSTVASRLQHRDFMIRHRPHTAFPGGSSVRVSPASAAERMVRMAVNSASRRTDSLPPPAPKGDATAGPGPGGPSPRRRTAAQGGELPAGAVRPRRPPPHWGTGPEHRRRIIALADESVGLHISQAGYLAQKVAPSPIRAHPDGPGWQASMSSRTYPPQEGLYRAEPSLRHLPQMGPVQHKVSS